jgi:hypothetical protein
LSREGKPVRAFIGVSILTVAIFEFILRSKLERNGFLVKYDFDNFLESNPWSLA